MSESNHDVLIILISEVTVYPFDPDIDVLYDYA